MEQKIRKQLTTKTPDRIKFILKEINAVSYRKNIFFQNNVQSLKEHFWIVLLSFTANAFKLQLSEDAKLNLKEVENNLWRSQIIITKDVGIFLIYNYGIFLKYAKYSASKENLGTHKIFKTCTCCIVQTQPHLLRFMCNFWTLQTISPINYKFNVIILGVL